MNLSINKREKALYKYRGGRVKRLARARDLEKVESPARRAVVERRADRTRMAGESPARRAVSPIKGLQGQVCAQFRLRRIAALARVAFTLTLSRKGLAALRFSAVA